MGYGDWIFLAVLIVIAVLGALIGFGRGLKFLTGGIIGIIISVVLCYLFGGMILDMPFVRKLLSDLAAHWANSKFLTSIRLEIIIYYIALFIIFTILRILIVLVIRSIAESDVLVMKIFNKIGGVVIFVGLAFLLMFFVFQIIQWIGGNSAANFYKLLKTNCNAIVRPLYEHNPMQGLVKLVTGK